MRIVSLLPAATEIVCALGLADDLVGVTHACSAVPEAAGVRIVTRPGASPVPTGPGMARLDVDDALVAELGPDLILAPGSWRPSRAALPGPGGSTDDRVDEPTVVRLAPTSIEGILHAISTVGAMTSAEDEALDLVELLRERLADVEEVVQARRAAGHPAPRVVALEWLDPPYAAGRWVPEQVRRAGGWDLLGRDGEAATLTTWQDVHDLDPEMVLLMPRDADLAGTLATWERSPRPPAWSEIHAVRRGQVFALDAAAYFSNPGPRAIDGIELLAELFDPTGFVDVAPAGGWVPVD
jgi:iron complex transport system substrate-binding protein